MEKRLIDAEKIRAAEDIRQLKHVWCAALDNQDWETLGSLFTADATVSNSFIEGEPPEMPAGRFCGWLAATPKELRSMHHLHNFQATFDSPTEATGRWEFLAGAWNTATAPSAFKVQYIWGTYLERYRKLGNQWRISSVTPRWTHQAAGSFGAVPPRPPLTKVSAAMLGAADMDSVLAIEEIRQLKARYCSSIDDKNWSALRAVFTDDAAFGVFGGMPIGGPDEFVSFLSQRLGSQAASVHHVHNPLIEFTSPLCAHGRWELEYWNWFGGEPLDGGHGFGLYKEHYRRTPGGWRIAALGAQPADVGCSNGSPGVAIDVGRLSALEEIKALRARWCAAIDGRDWTALKSVFPHDPRLGQPEGSDGKTVHHLHNFQAEFTSDSEATGRWEVVKFVWLTGTGNASRTRRIEWGCYRDAYQRTAEGWRIVSTRFDLSHSTEEYDRIAPTLPMEVSP
jgi:ketosteroid isomerase-like protein